MKVLNDIKGLHETLELFKKDENVADLSKELTLMLDKDLLTSLKQVIKILEEKKNET